MRPLSGGEYRRVEGLARGLSVLDAMNKAAGGRATVRELAQATQLHRTTVRRLLETLLAQGYVRRSESDDSYRLTLAVRQLSEGFTDDEWVSAVVTPALAELLRAVVWPSDLTTLDGDAMIVRETTHRFSPLSFHRAMVGRRLPLLHTASGRAYMAHCGAAERGQLLRLLVAQGGAQAALARNAVLVKRVLDRVRENGFAGNEGDWALESHISAIALPVRRRRQVLGCINIVFLKRAMSVEVAARRYLPALQQAVATIERRLSDRRGVVQKSGVA